MTGSKSSQPIILRVLELQSIQDPNIDSEKCEKEMLHLPQKLMSTSI